MSRNQSKRYRAQECLQTILRQFRQDAGLRQIDLAAKLSEPQSFVSKYESGERGLSILEFRSICLALGSDTKTVIDRLEECIGEVANEG